MIDFVLSSPQHIAIRKLLKTFPNFVFEDNLPQMDSDVTAQPYAIVVSEISDVSKAQSCEGRQARRMILQTSLYERCDDSPVGFLRSLEQVVTQNIESLVGVRNGNVNITNAIFQSAVNQPFTGEELRARIMTYALDYTI